MENYKGKMGKTGRESNFRYIFFPLNNVCISPGMIPGTY
jgi:hypothetical protein